MNLRPNIMPTKPSKVYKERALLAGNKAQSIFEMTRPIIKRIYAAIENSNERDVADALIALAEGSEEIVAEKLASALRKARLTRDVSNDVVVLLECFTLLAKGQPTEAEALLENYERYGGELPQ